ncbi:MAG TPA: hypothetical protein PLE92_01765 [Lentisphaeria bacterium]|nr:hypothetical protein [Lentisphaerota bacterium]OQC17452.1 MAG: hypothetical protein BWX73_00274 [Lentisphaerae bacterium ADurb.Bin082]HQC51830.1 hypothetical protein [Lentisphaeria bacterium]HQL86255.1 hypothetical protein [Lentisphaeria bacterium]
METPTMMTIQLPGGWLLQHSPKACGGPAELTWNGHVVLRDFECRVDGLSNTAFSTRALRFFHKGGQSVASCEGQVSPLSGHALRQIIRYGANVARVTWDLAWRKDTVAKIGVEIGSATLVGTWRRVLVIPDFTAWTSGQAAQWHDLVPGKNLVFNPIPLAVVCERDDGVQIEFSMGFDVWRWQRGLGDFGSERSQVALAVSDQEMTFQRQILQGGEDIMPEAREYRFCSQIAWRAPTSAEPAAFPPATTLEFQANGEGLAALPTAGSGGAPSFVLDFAAMPVAAAARRDDGSGLPCWESNVTQRAAHRAIRQIAAAGTTGFLRLDGLTPGGCQDGSHCDRKHGVAHWDLQGILTFANWARQCLGDGWTMAAPQPHDPWRLLPSLADPLAVTGFRSSIHEE